jgi:hypothetical protein
LVTVDGSGRRHHATIEAMVLIELATDPAGAHVESYRALVARGAMAILHPDRARPWRLLDPVAYHHSLLPRSVNVVARPAVGDPQKVIVEGTLLLVLSPPPADAQVRADLLFVEGAVWEVAEPLSFAFQRTGERVVEVLRPGKYRIGAYGVPTFVGPVGAPR